MSEFSSVAPLPQPIGVSVIVRSMGRACLADALASLFATIGVDLEIMLVNALGGHHATDVSPPQHIKLQLVNQDGPPLGRAAAANAGLASSSGAHVLFLDDDDLVDPDHLVRLADALSQAPAEAVAVYTGVRMEDAASGMVREHNEPWSTDRLNGMNYLPIHAVMFRAAPVRGKIRFDEALPLFEDWDFWLRLGRLGTFLRLPGCSATYRLALGQSGLSGRRDLDRVYDAHAQVLRKCMAESPLALSRSLFWFDTALQHLVGEKAAQAAQQASSNAYIGHLEHRVRTEEAAAIDHRHRAEQLDAELNQIREHARVTLDTLIGTQQQLARTHAELMEIRESIVWKLSAPLRKLVGIFRS